MKLQIYRQSSLPPNLADLDVFREEYRQRYDAAALEADTDMQKMQQLVEELNTSMGAKYGQPVYATLPATAKAWKALVAQYGGDPVMVGKRNDGKGLLLVIMDEI